MINDHIVQFNVKDESIVDPVESFVDPSLALIMPYFSQKGIDNKIIEFTSSSLWKNAVGEDVTSVKTYGHNGLVAESCLAGGGRLLGCRLMPSNAKYASLIISVAARNAQVDLYERDPETNLFKLDASGDKIVIAGGPVDGKELKVIVTAGVVGGDNNNVSTLPATDGDVNTEAWTVYPIYFFSYKGRGVCGNDNGISIMRDTDRDDSAVDGRRYTMTWSGKSSTGISVALHSDEIMFSTNPAAVLSVGSTVSEDLAQVFPTTLPFEFEEYEENYEALLKTLDPFFDESLENLDIFTGVDTNGVEYDKVLMNKTETVDLENTVQYMTGGTDGSLGLGETVVIDTVDTVVDAAHITATRIDLLKSFYNCDIDQDILDTRIIDGGIMLDAFMPTEVKKVMLGSIPVYRPDIAVIVDTGLVKTVKESLTTAKDLAGSVPGTGGYMCLIAIHPANTTNRGKNLVTSPCYEIAYGLTSTYVSKGKFAIYAGWENGLWKVSKPTFTARITKGDTELGPLKKAGVLFARILDKTGRTCWMSDLNLYHSDYSSLKSFRNIMVLGNARRTVSNILVKRAFDDVTAVESMRKTKADLDEVFTDDLYPSSITVETKVYQTKRDIANKTASVDLVIYYPEIKEGFMVTVISRRESQA